MCNQTWLLGTLSLFALSLGAACSDVSEQFFVVQNQVPTEGCVIPGERSAAYQGRGVMDVALVSDGALTGYRMFPLLQNDLPVRGEGTEPNRISLSSFNVRLHLEPGAPVEIASLFAAGDIKFSSPWSGTIQPGGGLLSASVPVVPAEIARQIRASHVLESISGVEMTAYLRAKGETLAETVDSREFAFPIHVCQGCLIANVQDCPYAAVNKGNVCNVAQDEPVDCCTDGVDMFCPSRAPDEKK